MNPVLIILTNGKGKKVVQFGIKCNDTQSLCFRLLLLNSDVL